MSRAHALLSILQYDSRISSFNQGFFKTKLELHIKSSDAVLKTLLPATDVIELIPISEKW